MACGCSTSHRVYTSRGLRLFHITQSVQIAWSAAVPHHTECTHHVACSCSTSHKAYTSRGLRMFHITPSVHITWPVAAPHHTKRTHHVACGCSTPHKAYTPRGLWLLHTTQSVHITWPAAAPQEVCGISLSCATPQYCSSSGSASPPALRCTTRRAGSPSPLLEQRAHHYCKHYNY